jgi:hypothetical protein
MKILLLIILIALVGCDRKGDKISGYIVHKQYTKGHMSNQEPQEVNYASFGYVPFHAPVTRSSPHFIKSSFR